jgi:hypothetical protein
MTAPEPWRDPPPPEPPRRRPSDPHLLARDRVGTDQSTEFGFGPGLVAPHLNGRPPSEGGVYMPKAPRVELVGQSLRPRQKRRPHGDARGYPGEQVAR